MKKRNVLRTVSAICLLIVLLFSSDLIFGQERKGDESNAKLEKRLQFLETLVKEQQIQIETLKKDILKLRIEKPMVTLPADSALNYLSKKFPNGAKPFTFNGRTYYIVPLGDLSDSKMESLEKK